MGFFYHTSFLCVSFSFHPALTKEFLYIYGKSPSKLQKKVHEQIKLAQKQVSSWDMVHLSQ